MNNAVITLHVIDGQPLVHDENLARELGYNQLRDIRQLIERNEDELQGYGPLARQRTAQLRSNGATHYVNAFYLNEEQVLLLSMFSDAPKAKEIRKEIIAVYQAWRKGHLEPTLSDFTNPAIAARVWADAVEKLRIAVAKAEKLAIENDDMSQVIGSVDLSVEHVAAQMDPRVDRDQVMESLKRAGYLYRKGGVYCVYSRHRSSFEEKTHPKTGHTMICIGQFGRKMLMQMLRKGQLTLVVDNLAPKVQ